MVNWIIVVQPCFVRGTFTMYLNSSVLGRKKKGRKEGRREGKEKKSFQANKSRGTLSSGGLT